MTVINYAYWIGKFFKSIPDLSRRLLEDAQPTWAHSPQNKNGVDIQVIKSNDAKDAPVPPPAMVGRRF